jgi:putative SOS response-associated peptidase YedK
MLRPIHDRMPAILAADHFDSWLNMKAPLAQAKALLRPYPGAMTICPVSDGRWGRLEVVGSAVSFTLRQPVGAR